MRAGDGEKRQVGRVGEKDTVGTLGVSLAPKGKSFKMSPQHSSLGISQGLGGDPDT